MRGGMSLIRSLVGIRPISHAGAGAGREILLYVVELKSSLRRRLARYTHARRMPSHYVENSIARLSFGSADTHLRSSCTHPRSRVGAGKAAPHG
jgi:hypothetical protein